ncbi:MAG: cobalt transporter CbiM [Chloroflexota bacterium]
MHIPDGFINAATAGTAYAVSAAAVVVASKRARQRLGERHVPLIGVMAAFIFAAQMLNFPVAGGTSGHFLGAALAAILLGPWAGVLIMSAVLLVQSLVFQDGGLLALGANILNMGVIASFVAYYTFRGVAALTGESKRGRLAATFVASWLAVVLASLACALELAVSGTSPLRLVVPAMGGVHALIGIGEGIITTSVVALLAGVRADLLQLQKV